MRSPNFTTLLFFFGLGVCPLLMGLLFFWSAGQTNRLACKRLESTHVNCQIERAFLGIIPTDQATLSRITGTELTSSCDSDGCTYAIDLITADEVVPLSNLSTSDLKGVEAEKERIDNFLNDTEAKLIEFTSGPAWIGMLLSTPFILVGGIITAAGIVALKTGFRIE
jgi:hypothetical protein